jgi:hypothetical protein
MLEFSLKIFYGVWSFVIVYFQQNKSLLKCMSLWQLFRNKLDHSEKKYELPLWWCTIKNKDLIILVFASFPWHIMKLYQHSDSLHFLNNSNSIIIGISYLKAYIIILNAHLKNIWHSPLKYAMGVCVICDCIIFNKIKVYWNVWVFDYFHSSFCIDTGLWLH